MPKPTKEDWVEISNIFYSKTNFPNCLGAIDGKHIRCRNPNNSGSFYFNYKKYFSIVLMAIVIGVRTGAAEAAYAAPGLSLGPPGPANIK
ncbi:unnamed protein product [Macrosiphum euphorbiae]|uniref:DDE Tnp4 domain-containing protein n=1 Tax=Macrosiphum euphorbiae TaxID=13131 RepID=A0AAV0W356_9HEMI|nr:unnamed protein product [Macrosiphum euphorbiae]